MAYLEIFLNRIVGVRGRPELCISRIWDNFMSLIFSRLILVGVALELEVNVDFLSSHLGRGQQSDSVQGMWNQSCLHGEPNLGFSMTKSQ